MIFSHSFKEVPPHFEWLHHFVVVVDVTPDLGILLYYFLYDNAHQFYFLLVDRQRICKFFLLCCKVDNY